MSQNRSTAVMQRRVEAHDSLDDFPTPPWAARALVEHVIRHMPYSTPWSRQSVWEPASNRGYLATGLADYFERTYTSDIFDYREDEATLLPQGSVRDFLWPTGELPTDGGDPIDWIITNPPFRLAEQFFRRAAEFSPTHGIALLVRTSFLEGTGRYRDLFSRNPPSVIAQFSERVPMVKGRLDRKASTATSYCWLVWASTGDVSRFWWIPPCRKALERKEDYGT